MKTFLSIIVICSITISTLSAQCPKHLDPGIHTVQSGETLYRISEKYQVSIDQILVWNNLNFNDPLVVCSQLYVKPTSAPAKTKTINERLSQPEEIFTSRGESKNLASYKKQAGKKHEVQVGENVAGLAELYGYSQKRFRDMNLLGNDEELTPGSIVLSSDCACGRIGFDSFDAKTDKNYFEKDPNPVDYTSEKINVEFTSEKTPPTKANADFMSSVELSMVDEINLLRSNPRGYIKYVKEYVADQKANNGFPINQPVVDELIRELQQLSTLSHLETLDCIYSAAKNHGNDLLSMGQTDHVGSDGSWPWTRVRRSCPDLTDGNENLVGGPESVRESVIILLIDDGIPTRGHRKTLLNSDWKYVACHKIGKVGFMPNCWVQKFGY